MPLRCQPITHHLPIVHEGLDTVVKVVVEAVMLNQVRVGLQKVGDQLLDTTYDLSYFVVIWAYEFHI